MKPADAFGVVVRVLGLLGVLAGIAYFASFAWLHLAGADDPKGFGPLVYALYGCLTGGLGMCFLRGADVIVNFAYPDEQHKNDTEANHLDQQPPPDRPAGGE